MNRALTVLQDVLIGLKAKVVESSNPNYVGLSGVIIDETKKTLTLKDGSKKRIIIKRNTKLHLTLDDETVIEVEGDAIIGRPEERIKRRLRRRW